MKSSQLEKVRLDELLCGRLPERVISEIGTAELTINEITQWETAKPKFRLVTTENDLTLDVHLRISTKRTIAVLVGATGLLCAGIKLLVQYLPLLLLVSRAGLLKS